MTMTSDTSSCTFDVAWPVFGRGGVSSIPRVTSFGKEHLRKYLIFDGISKPSQRGIVSNNFGHWSGLSCGFGENPFFSSSSVLFVVVVFIRRGLLLYERKSARETLDMS